MSQHDPESTRDRLITAAARLLWERSFAATSVDDICQLADARKGSFYHFFASKTALALEVVSHRWAWVQTQAFDVVEAGQSRGLERLSTLCLRLNELYAPGTQRTPAVLGSPIGHLGQEMAHQDEVLRRAVAAVFEAQAARLERWLDEAVALGQMPPGPNAVRARQCLALIEGALLFAKIADEPGLFLSLCRGIPRLISPEAAASAAQAVDAPAASGATGALTRPAVAIAVEPVVTAPEPAPPRVPARRPAALPELD